MAKLVDALAPKANRYRQPGPVGKSARVGSSPIRRAPLYKLPTSVRLSLRDSKKRIEQAAFERRYHARALLFGKGGGSIQRLSKEERRYVRFVWEEAYQAYLHAFRTGQTRYQGWEKRRQIVALHERIEPMNRKGHYNQWWRSQKARYLHFDLPRKLKES